MTTPDALTALIGTYAAAWSATTRDAILTHLVPCWTAHSSYTDPMTPTATGPEALADVIQDFQAKFPGGQLRPTSVLDAHGPYGRFSWLMTLPAPVTIDGQTFGAELPGFDFVEFTPDGRHILRIVGFFGPLLPASARVGH